MFKVRHIYRLCSSPSVSQDPINLLIVQNCKQFKFGRVRICVLRVHLRFNIWNVKLKIAENCFKIKLFAQYYLLIIINFNRFYLNYQTKKLIYLVIVAL